MNRNKLESIAENILVKLRSRPGHFYKPSGIKKNLGITSGELASSLKLLKEWGYRIKTDKDGGYGFISAPDSLIETEIKYKLNTKLIGRTIHAFKTTQSTNRVAAQLALSGAPDGTLVVAETQTKGRGRYSRSWFSPEKLGVYCSIVLYPKIHPTLAPGLSLMSAVALAETISKSGKINVGIKWPNDVLIDGRKTAGILTELSADGDKVNYVVAGIGININHKSEDFPDELKNKATSIRISLGKEVDRLELLKKFLFRFESEYLNFNENGLSGIRKKILKYSTLMGRPVTLKMGHKSHSGIVLDIDELGRLVMETKTGMKAFSAGEVTIQEH